MPVNPKRSGENRSRISPELSQRIARREQLRRRIMHRRIAGLAGGLCLLAALIVLLVAVLRKEPPAPPETEKQYIYLWDSAIEVDPNYPASTISASSFVTVGDRKRYLSGSVQSSTGIDVSQHNGEIDWEAVAADGIEFAMIRVGYRGYTEGEIYMDERFAENYAGAREAGLKVGVYFFSQAVNAEEAREEAEFTLDALKGLKLDLPVAFDWETIGEENARADDIDRDTLTACTLEFCRKVSKKFDAMIYTNAYQGYYLLNLGELADYPIWFAGYAQTPIFYYRFDIWQYTNEGAVAGIEGNVDVNLCFTEL